MKFVLDASAIIAYLRDEPGADRVAELLVRPSVIHVHAVNLLEVYYKLVAFGGDLAASEALDELRSLGFVLHDRIDDKLTLRSGFFKSRYPFLSLADSVCVALAETLRATTLTCDRPFANVQDKVDVELLR